MVLVKFQVFCLHAGSAVLKGLIPERSRIIRGVVYNAILVCVEI